MNIEIRSFQKEDENAIVQLWHDCKLVVPPNDPHKDIKLKIEFQPDLLLVGLIDGRIVATVMAGYEGHRGWFNYFAVALDLQRSGIGRQMAAEAEKQLRTLGCPKIDLIVRKSNMGVIDFYKKIGFYEDDIVLMGKWLEKG